MLGVLLNDTFETISSAHIPSCVSEYNYSTIFIAYHHLMTNAIEEMLNKSRINQLIIITHPHLRLIGLLWSHASFCWISPKIFIHFGW
jgi:hypothetical protein